MRKIKIKLIPNEEGRLVSVPIKTKKGDWIDLRSAGTYAYSQGDFIKVSFGIALELPVGFEAYIVARSSLYKNHGLILVNSIGVVDNSYHGDKDIWMGQFIAMKSGEVNFDDRICQFRIQRNQPSFSFEVVDTLGNNSRGGFGSTNKK